MLIKLKDSFDKTVALNTQNISEIVQYNYSDNTHKDQWNDKWCIIIMSNGNKFIFKETPEDMFNKIRFLEFMGELPDGSEYQKRPI